MRLIAMASLAMIIAGSVGAKVVTKTVDYDAAGVACKGYMAYDDAKTGKRPGVIVVHEWWGLNEYPKKRAEQLAELGYAAFAVDMYGGGKTTTDPKQAGTWAGEVKSDRKLMLQRATAGLDAFLKAGKDVVDPAKIAEIGYCFGGTTVLEVARSGADVKGVVSFHGSIPDPLENDKAKARVLILTGGDDTYAPADKVKALEGEIRKAGADVSVVSYPGAVHGFTNPGNGGDNSKGVAYNKDADEKSWAAMMKFFSEIFADKKS